MNLATELSWACRRTRSPIRLAAVAMMLLVPLAQQAAAGESELPSLVIPCFVAAIIGAGLIALDRDRGLQGLAFTRPIRRSSYVLGRWSGVTLLGGLLLTMQLALSLMTSAALSADPLPEAGEVAAWLGLCWLSVAATAAAMSLLSSALAGIADACVVISGGMFLSVAVELAGYFGHDDVVAPLAKQASLSINPHLLLGSEITTIVAVASNAALALVAAVLVMNWREIPSRGEA